MKFLFLCSLLPIVLLVFAFLILHFMEKRDKAFTGIRMEQLAFLLLLGVSIAFIYRNFIFGNSVYAFNDIGSDTTQQYLPLYIDLIHDISAGEVSLWNSNFGMGTSCLTYQSIYFDPFNIILIPIGVIFGDASLPCILIIIQILKMAVCGLVFLRLSSFFCKNSIAKVLGAWLYSCNGYLSLWGNHYFLGTACVFFVIILFFIESHLNKKKLFSFVGLSLSVGLLLSWSVYIAFMILLQAAAYAVFRCLYLFTNVKEGAKHFFSLVIPVIIGILIGCLVAIPVACLLLFDSVRIASDASLLDKLLSYVGHFQNFDFFSYAISRFMGNNYLSVGTDLTTVSNYYELPQIGCSAVFYSFLALFLIWMCRARVSSRQKKVIIASLLIAVFYFIDCFLPGLLNVFAGVSYRASFAFSCIGSLMVAFVFDKITEGRIYAKHDFIISAVPTLLLLLVFLANGSESAKLLSIFALLISVLLFTVLVLGCVGGKRLACLTVALILIGSTSVVDAYVTENFRHPLTIQSFPSSSNVQRGQSSAALNHIKSSDDSVYRLDKTFAEWSVFQDGLIQGYDGVTSYNSTRPKEEIEILSNLWPDNTDGSKEHVYTSYSYAPSHAEPTSLLGIKYILSGDELHYDWLNLVDVINSIYVYENRDFKSFALGYHSTMPESLLASSDSEEKNATIESGYAIVEDDSPSLNGKRCEIDGYSVRENNAGDYEIYVNSDEDVLVTLSVANSPGWMADIDGVTSEVFTANYGLVSTVVPSGNHTVRFYYVPYGMNIGFGAAIIGIALLVVSCFFLRKKTKGQGFNG